MPIPSPAPVMPTGPLSLAKGAGAWLIILLCAVMNGALREFVLVPYLGQTAAFVASGVILSLVVLLLALVLVPRLGPLSQAGALCLGLFWLGLTLAFEFGFGRLIQRRSWGELLEAYTFTDGNIWPIVLLVVALAPLLTVNVRRAIR